MPRIAILCFLGTFGLSRLAAHDYWIEPAPLEAKLGDTVALRVFVGEDLKADDERPFQAARTTRWEVLSAAGRHDLQAETKDGSKPAGSLKLANPGTHLVVLERTPALIALEGGKFTEYLREENLGDIIIERAKRGESGQPGRERYRRFLKSYVRVGNAPEAAVPSTKQRLDLAPDFRKDRGPRLGDRLRVRVTFDGKPLARTTVFAEARLNQNASFARGLATDADGWVEVELNAAGLWLVRLVHMRRAPAGDTEADWESFWAACTLTVPAS